MNREANIPKRVVIFRTASDYKAEHLYKELNSGRLRQGWGRSGLGLTNKKGNAISKEQWHDEYRSCYGEKPSSRRFSALACMLDIQEGDVVIAPKLPEWNQFSIARVSGRYEFEDGPGEFGHIIPVDPKSVRTFSFLANGDAYKVSSVFSRANHRYPVTFAYDEEHIKSAVQLLESESCTEEQEKGKLIQAALDGAIEKAAEAMKEEIKSWNGHQFEAAVKLAFENQNYEILSSYRKYDRQGGDVDVVVSPPSNNYGLFMPQEIAVQIKWKQGIDQDDIEAVNQLVNWQESEAVQKFVISSADKFTKECEKKAEEEGITLIGGVNTMYFLMGLPNLIRESSD